MEITQTQTAPAAAASATSGRSMISSDFETFLRMLTTQMQNQDPLNPLESTEFAVQLATFSSVEQQVRTNDLLSGLGQTMNLMSLSQLAGWVGREARVAAPAWFDGAPVVLYPDPPAIADQAVLVVRDGAGAEVYRGQVPVTHDPFAWNGLDSTGEGVPPGLYSFTLQSFAYGDLIAEQQMESYQRIDEARVTGGETRLVLQGGTEIAAGDVTGLRAGG